MTNEKKLKNKKILVTYGPTWIALDDMRVISNRSSGSMGKLIIDELIKTGARITALEGPVLNPLQDKKITLKKFTFFDEFAKLFKKELKKNFDIVIHAAAVSDFKPKTMRKKKISSDKNLTLTLIPTEKLITSIKKIAPKSMLVGFKLGSGRCQRQLKKEALMSVENNKCDLVVANSFKNDYTGFIFNNNGNLMAKGKTRKTISSQLVKILCKQQSVKDKR